MLPSILSTQVVKGLQNYVRSAFTLNSAGFENTIDEFLAQEDNLIKGPYVSIALPFRVSNTPLDFFPHFTLPFSPYAHQSIAYNRLTQSPPQSTLVATGTGSGKTECFLYPVLNHCASETKQGNKGVKAIIIYPMNALATDQAKRFAKECAKNEGLQDVRVGLFVGGGDKDSVQKRMSSQSVITCKETLRADPPDILLTNYKMLDYLLMRPQDQSLWEHNTEGTLKYLVVDELHTFDGAQGSDLACLIRRLKYHLNANDQDFACVGTSATVGDALAPLIDYASNIFDAPFDESSVIKEDRLAYQEYLQDSVVEHFDYPSAVNAHQLIPVSEQSQIDYLNEQISLWFADLPKSELDKILIDEKLDGTDGESDSARSKRIELGLKIKSHQFFTTLLKLLNGQIKPLGSLAQQIAPAFLLNEDQAKSTLESFISLIAFARAPIVESEEDRIAREQSGKPRMVLPLLNVRQQLWLRELRRLVARFEKSPTLTFADDLAFDNDSLEHHFPVINCRDCHSTGFGVIEDAREEIQNDLNEFYQHFFSQSPSVRVLFPLMEGQEPPKNVGAGRIQKICKHCLNESPLEATSCQNCDNDLDGEGLVRVFKPQLVTSGQSSAPKFKNECPVCKAKNGLNIIGAQSATLSSIAINQIYASRFNENKKLITFSDSVQDAAHRAGFFDARTWPLMVRGHIGKVATQNSGRTLDEFAHDVVTKGMEYSQTQEDFVANFIAPDMEWQNDYIEFTQTGALKPGSLLLDNVKKRLEWAVYSEFGLRSSFGRNLIRTHDASISFVDDGFNVAIENVFNALREELGDDFLHVTQDNIAHFAIGVLERMRENGAIHHPFLKRYVELVANWHAIKNSASQFFMPPWSQYTKVPQFLTLTSIKNFDPILGSKTTPSWHQNWMIRCLGHNQDLLFSHHTPLIYQRLLSELSRQFVVTDYTLEGAKYDGEKAWGLDNAALTINTDVAVLGCSECVSTKVIARKDLPLYVDMPCTRSGCLGHLNREIQPQEKSWQSAEMHRVNAHEHTGLLEREVREQTENSFIDGKSALSVNLLSATPTLEMGIDIGGLSSVLLCSVPPAQANYLQRIGRAGRQDGNAFNMTVAAADPHDLYFYQEPQDMMAGAVSPPGVFLDASAVLERQLCAFCMDRWIKTGVEPQALGKNVKEMLDATEAYSANGTAPDVYPYNFLTYVRSNEESLFAQFTMVFDTLSDSSTQKLEAFLKHKDNEMSLFGRISRALGLLVKDRKSLKARSDKLKRTIDAENQRPDKPQNHAETIEELTRERQALLALMRSMNNKRTLNFMTDEGLLPNYAFPEGGVTLRSVLWRLNEQAENHEGKKYVTTTYEYERPASSALSEFAPSSNFYASGSKVTIEQIDMRVSEIETWRLCPHCNHSVQEIEANTTAQCPKCGHDKWGDIQQSVQMLKLRQVYARSSAKEAKISDDSDTRTPTFFQRHMLVTFDKADVNFAYQVENDDLPFGFEYLNKVSLKDINFGQNKNDAEEFSAAGDVHRKSGFKVCKDCGKVDLGRGDVKHDYNCKYFAKPMEAEFEDFLYLYRNLESEALRILLPVTNQVTGKVSEASLAAALQLGMKRYFKGSVDHLKGCIYKEPEDSGDSYRYFLVIYDTVPGGTGSLKDLMQSPENLLKLLSLAQEAMMECDCHEHGKDGCYKCVYAYRDRGRMKHISKARALSMLGNILDEGNSLKRIKSLSDISLETVSDSELENLFIDVMKNQKDFNVTENYISAKKVWLVNSKQNPQNSWVMHQHVRIGEVEGVDTWSEPDFVLEPARQSMNTKKIAIFLDGYRYHESIVDEDVKKRTSILNSNKYYVWTLVWDDLVGELDASASKAFFSEYFILSNNGRKLLSGLDALQHTLPTITGKIQDKHSWQLLTQLLNNPAEHEKFYQQAGLAYFAGMLEPQFMGNSAVKQSFEYEMRENASFDRVAELCDGKYVFGGRLDSLNTERDDQFVEVSTTLPFSVFGALAQKRISGQTPSEFLASNLKTHLCFDDRPLGLANEGKNEADRKKALFGFWRMVNIGQYLPDFTFSSRAALQDYSFYASAQTSDEKATDEHVSPIDSEAWDDILNDELLEDADVRLMQEMGFDAPVVGEEFAGESLEPIGEVELYWPELKIAFLLEKNTELETLLNKQGIRFVIGDICKESLTALKELTGES
ncbi:MULTISPECIES: DEAD/DEAH box helicase [Vibrio harveyi group]|uniref:DEAD/DEAH box helicase n=1 Tax=Vibrio harveyi group TaxID=717610 RepID=UPI001BD597F0|nr:DEAD/DEAH box helicase [Vibrio alginolyticus]MBT0110240.1 DEAD/DEAH box helicase [Vibrio alginolyticus]